MWQRDESLWHIQTVLINGDDGRVALSTTGGGGGEIPEPASMILLGTGMTGLAGAARRRFNKK